jgi:hypothetical protein
MNHTVRRLIFVSCGQLTEEERKLGCRIKNEIDKTDGYEGYFAATVQDLAGLAQHILDALRRATGAVVVLHPRGRVMSDQGQALGVRSSVWISQELAIMAYRQFFEGVNIPILAFKDDCVSLEGAMSAFIINPRPLESDEMVVSEVRKWLQNNASEGRPSEQDVFDQKCRTIEADDQLILAALVEEGGHNVKEVSVRRRLTERFGIDRNRASEIVKQRRGILSAMNLVMLRHNIYDGDEMSLHPTWEWYIRYAVAKPQQRALQGDHDDG